MNIDNTLDIAISDTAVALARAVETIAEAERARRAVLVAAADALLAGLQELQRRKAEDRIMSILPSQTK